jgi:hypothetical protein
MDDTRTELKRASLLVAVPDGSFDRLLDRRDRVRRRQRRASFIVAVLVAASALGGVALLMTGLREDHDEATGTGWQPTRDLSLGPNDSFYLNVQSSDLGDGQVRDEETWLAIDGSGEVRNRSTRQDKYPYPPTGLYGDGDFPIWLRHVPSLSKDPALLAAQLREDPWDWGSGPEPERLWDVTGLLLFETPYATPELRAAVFEVASDIEGVSVTTGDVDPVGRPAVSLRFSDPTEGATWTMYFDPGTHQAIAWTFRSSRGGYVWQLLESGIVEDRGARPTGQQWLAPPVPPDTG